MSQVSLCDFWSHGRHTEIILEVGLTCGRGFYSWQHQRGPVQRGQLIPGTDQAEWEKHTNPLLTDYQPQSVFLGRC